MALAVPRTIRIGPHSYVVRRVTEAEMPEDNGDCNFDRLEIALQRGLRRSKAREILLHEVLHGCTHPSLNQADRTFTDEDFVTAIAPALLQTLRDNPKLVAFLVEPDKEK